MTKSFEEFEVYKKSILLTKLVFELLNNKNFDKEFGFKDQMKRAVLSITNNIAEGSEYNNNRQFVRFLKYSKGSCAEVRNMLILSKELGFCEEENIKIIYEMSIEISQNISNFIKYLNSKLETSK
jgi:four helix bundle protein